MINLFARKGIDGLIVAACFHRDARMQKEGIQVAFFEGSADSMLLDLIANIGVAESVKAHLPASRRIVLHGAALSPGIAESVGRFLSLHPDIEVMAVHAIPLQRHKLFFWRIIAACMRSLLGADDTILFLSDHIN